ncbi:MAG TPA: hypothetical protein VMM13_15000 [Euzebya sp.]|nr:hypothetical protein [Euzebya sp.]
MMSQIVLGLARFLTPFVGWQLPHAIWRLHPVLGVSIAVAVLIVLRPRPGVIPTVRRRIARFAPLAPLALGLAMGLGIGLRSGTAVVALHMVIGVTALGVVDNALKHLLAAPMPTGRIATADRLRA